MTRHHENEAVSSSLYTQNDPWEPLVNFESFIRDDESIEDQVTGTAGLGAGDRGRMEQGWLWASPSPVAL